MPSADKRARKKENARAAREQREAAEKRRKRTRSTIIIGVSGVLIVGLFIIATVAGNGHKKKSATPPVSTTTTTIPAGCDLANVPKKTTKPTYKSPPAMTIDTSKTYVAHVDTTCGTFDINLAAAVAPKTVNSFVFLARNHFYDGLTFHRLVKDFVIQGGDPTGTGNGGPGYKLPTEPPKNGYQAGSVAMANAGADTTGSQFFVTVSANGAKELGGPPYLYSDLGTVTKGMDVVQKLMTFAQNTAAGGAPTHPIYMNKVTISES